MTIYGGKMAPRIIIIRKKWGENLFQFDTYGLPAKYIYYNSQLLAPIVCFAELILTDLWAMWVLHHALDFCTVNPGSNPHW